MFKQQMKRSTKAFTMIELLIVIGVLGILAVGVLAAVDPFEQLKKARDTNTRSSALALQTAFVRYYATHGELPWDNLGTGDCLALFGAANRNASAIPTGVAADDETNHMTGSATSCISLLEADGELKSNFVEALGGAAASMWINSPTRAHVSVCFAPQSRSIFAEENTKFDQAGVDQTTAQTVACTTALKAAGTSAIGTCFYCAM